MMNRSISWSNVLKFLLIALLVVAGLYFAKNFNISGIKTFLEAHEKLGIFTVILSYVLLSVTPVPAEPVTFLVLAWKGPLMAILLATIGNTIAAFMEYILGTGLGDLADFEKKKASLPFNLGRFPADSPVFLLLARMLPGYGSKVVSLVAGVYKVPVFTYIWTTIVSNLVGISVVVLSANGLLKLL
jgi:uncharacterized membrane protein YdjX (TVP38/TMEM64 family)